jgi:hypothetical protein
VAVVPGVLLDHMGVDPAQRQRAAAPAWVICRAKPGERVVTGQPIVELRGGDPARLEAAEAELAGAIGIGDDPPPARPLVLERAGLLSRAAEVPAPQTRRTDPSTTARSEEGLVRIEGQGSSQGHRPAPAHPLDRRGGPQLDISGDTGGFSLIRLRTKARPPTSAWPAGCTNHHSGSGVWFARRR